MKKKKMPREVSYIWARHANEEEIEVLTNKLIFASYPPHDNTSLIKQANCTDLVPFVLKKMMNEDIFETKIGIDPQLSK